MSSLFVKKTLDANIYLATRGEIYIVLWYTYNFMPF